MTDNICNIKFYKEDPKAIAPSVAYNGTSACFDLYATKTVAISRGCNEKIPCGIRVIIPEGYYLRFNTRSSLGYVKNLFVYPGILDASYTGNLDVKVYNLGIDGMIINEGDKFAQVEVLKLQNYELTEISQSEFENIQSKLETTGRGTKGWGSTGKNGII